METSLLNFDCFFSIVCRACLCCVVSKFMSSGSLTCQRLPFLSKPCTDIRIRARLWQVENLGPRFQVNSWRPAAVVVF